MQLHTSSRMERGREELDWGTDFLFREPSPLGASPGAPIPPNSNAGTTQEQGRLQGQRQLRCNDWKKKPQCRPAYQPSILPANEKRTAQSGEKSEEDLTQRRRAD